MNTSKELQIAKKVAVAMSFNYGVLYTVNLKTLDERSFDLDINGVEYDGGSYYITETGDIINAALPGRPVYGNINSSISQIVLNLSK
jgi:hypothetical protein